MNQKITAGTKQIKNVFQSKFSLPAFQREYKWETRHYVEMINDIQDTFLGQYDQSHGRNKVSEYTSYFLGSIITSASTDGKTPIIDGQQRLTSIFILLSYLHKQVKQKQIDGAADIIGLLRKVIYGLNDYILDFSTTRKRIFDVFFEDEKSIDVALSEISEISELDSSDKKILEAIYATHKELDAEITSCYPYFIDYVIEKVEVIDIAVPGEREAHRVFVTMNDRGLRLSPIDLLKGHILSHISSNNDNINCHSKWSEFIKKMRDLSQDEDSQFFKSFFRAKYALTMRGKKKGDADGDFDIIGSAYHRWFSENIDKIGIKNEDDYKNIVTETFVKYANVYMYIKSGESSMVQESPWLYYNACRKFTLQSMGLMAVVCDEDTDTDWKYKVSLVARLYDLIITSRGIECKETNYDSMREIAFSLTKALRNKTRIECLDFVKSEWIKHYSSIEKIHTVSYSTHDRSDILYILARIADFLEGEIETDGAVGFAKYWERDCGGKTYDIEHIFCNEFSSGIHSPLGFSSNSDYLDKRNNIGGLILLPKSRNRSLRDKPYGDKVGVYGTGNILGKLLHKDFYQNNPKLNDFMGRNSKLLIKNYEIFQSTDIFQRAELYKNICCIIWKEPT